MNTAPLKLRHPCAACGEVDGTPQLLLGKWTLLRCKRCDLVRLTPLPTPDELGQVYDSGHYYTGSPPQHRVGLVALLQDLVGRTFWNYPGPPPGILFRLLGPLLLWPLKNRFLPVPFPGRWPVLDIGCGNGQRLLDLQDQGCTRLFGLEPSADAARQAKAATRAHIYTAPLHEAGLPVQLFQLVIMNQVLEHVPDPASTLRQVRGLLRPGGQLYLTVPNFVSAEARFFGAHWTGLQVPEHLHHFTPETLRRMVEGAGLRITVWRTDTTPLVTRDSLARWCQARPSVARRFAAALPTAAWWPLCFLLDRAGRGQMLRLVAVRDSER